MNPGMIFESTRQEYLDNYGMTETEANEIALFIKNPDRGFVTNLTRGFLNAGIEIGSERAGALVGMVARKYGGVNSPAFIRAVKRATIDKMLEKIPENEWSTKVVAALRAGAYHGPLGEIFEEEVGKLARTGILGEEYFVTSWEELAAQGIAFSVPGAAIGTAGYAYRIAKGDIPTEQDQNELRAKVDASHAGDTPEDAAVRNNIIATGEQEDREDREEGPGGVFEVDPDPPPAPLVMQYGQEKWPPTQTLESRLFTARSKTPIPGKS